MKFDRKDDIEFIKWSRRNKIAAHFTCELCGRRGIELHCHHKNSWDSFPEERYDDSNAAVICASEHHMFHSIYNYGKNTELQYEEFKQTYKILMKLAENNNTTKNIVRNIISICKDDGYAPDGYTA